MLKICFAVLSRRMDEINQGDRPKKQQARNSIQFVKANQKNFLKRPKPLVTDDTWKGKWETAADLPDCQHFFPIPTQKKPDIVIWSDELKTVYLIELTVPHEDNIDAAQTRKDERYEKLLDECEENGWSAKHFPIEVGCRGFIGHRLKNLFHFVGLKRKDERKVLRQIEETVEKASHWIWLKRADDTW